MKDFVCAKMKFGSHLYGTNTINSDIDYRTFIVPNLQRYMLDPDRKSMVKVKVNPDGSIATANAIMGAGCVEEETIDINRFFLDIAAGEVLSIESFFAILQGRFDFVDAEFYQLCCSFNRRFGKQINVDNMMALGVTAITHQVRNSEKLNELREAINIMCELSLRIPNLTNARLNEIVDGETIIDHLTKHSFKYITSGQLKTSKNGENKLNSIHILDKAFGETTHLTNVIKSLQSLESKFGHRIKNNTVSLGGKALLHAIRGFQQAAEFYETGMISFPRPNADQLVGILTNPDTASGVAMLEDFINNSEIHRTEKPPIDVSEFLETEVFEYFKSCQYQLLGDPFAQ